MNSFTVMKTLLAAISPAPARHLAAVTTAALWFLAGSVQAALITDSWSSGFANAGVVPDGNPTGWSDSRTLSGIPDNSILDVTVTLQVSGGWNGDLYAYLAGPGGGFAVLLNRPGVTSSAPFGYSDAGLNITFQDNAPNGDIHLYQTVPDYATSIANGSAWAPDGRVANPATVVDTDPRTAFLSSFDGLDPNGSWTLFVADLSSGNVSTVTSWGLQIDAVPLVVGVPDAANTFLALGLALTGLVWFARCRPRQSTRSKNPCRLVRTLRA